MQEIESMDVIEQMDALAINDFFADMRQRDLIMALAKIMGARIR